MTQVEALLKVENVQLKLGGNLILKGVSFDLQAGEIACLLGKSGCGKTTALRAIAGFEQIQSGKIELAGDCLSDGKQHIPAHKRQVGMVFQDYALFPHLSVKENILFGLKHLTKNERNQRVSELMALIGLQDMADKYPHQLSGGQQQRVSLARALAIKPKLILLDEPFSNLDVDLRGQLSRQVRELLKKENVSAIMVTHDQTEAFTVADKVGVMCDGQIEQWGTPIELQNMPSTAFVAQFVGDGVLLDAWVVDNNTLTLNQNNHDKNQLKGQLLFNDKDKSCNQITETKTADINHKQPVKVLIRPHHVQLLTHQANDNVTNEPSENHYLGTVISADFRGTGWLYHISLAEDTIHVSGGSVLAWQPFHAQHHATALDVGETVKLVFHTDSTGSWVVFAE